MNVNTTETHQRTPRRAAVASWIGSALEYYDFAVYGTAAALVLNKLFFPEDAPTAVSVLLAMGTVGVAYVVRPLGALIMGPLADRLGRRFVLMLTLFLIGGATFAIGCLPTYNQVGYLAPVLLVLCRMIQGLSAAGEQASAISMSLEHADECHRGFTTSWTLQGTQFGTLLATMVFIPFRALLDDEALHSWGWRIPFWLSAFVVVAAYIIRRKLEEPPSFHETAASGVVMSPLTQTLRFHKLAVLRIAGCAMVNSVNMVFTVFSVSFATNGVGLDRSTMLWVPVVVNLVALGAIPLAARISDKIGRKSVFIVGVVGPAVLAYPYLWAISVGSWPLIFLFGILMSGLFYSASNAIWPSFYAEMFPTRVRATGVALGTQIGFAVSGGFAPAIASSLSGENLTNWVGPAVFLSVACLIAVIAALTAKETAHLDRADLETVQMSAAEAAALRSDLEQHGTKA
ncbi:MAG: MFS transporter [Galactobacter sp.]